LISLTERREQARVEVEPPKSTDVVANSADDKQVDGSHYQTQGEQHWNMMWRLYREAWFVGNITKYVLRYRRKNGIRDLLKAQHYLEKLLELENAEDSAQSK
jgi:hypothetical protein